MPKGLLYLNNLFFVIRNTQECNGYPSMGLENLFPSSEGWHVWNYSSDINIFNSFENEIADFHVKEKHMKRKKKANTKVVRNTTFLFIYLFKRYFTDCSFKPFHKSRVDSCSTSPWSNARYWWEELTPDWSNLLAISRIVWCVWSLGRRSVWRSVPTWLPGHGTGERCCSSRL